jgi:hypothetical protein
MFQVLPKGNFVDSAWGWSGHNKVDVVDNDQCSVRGVLERMLVEKERTAAA